MKSLFTIKWSPVGSNRKDKEEDTIFWWDWWLLAIQDGRVDISFEQLLIFVFGADAVPPLGFTPNPSIEFYDQEPGERRVPYSSTCSITLFLPRGVESDGDFTELMEMSIKCSHGFGKV
ncbi:G2/M phase-specific E3 ubiquitin-protein ligase [Austrofundulus limnaeus]|uniref:G2/M phase-specific E3 ubiquitin-protein ligase n=1 Tax=Austrofundulus limnaeus TaxID=52670 RepID=A0A2I4ALU4_AUSLI|nr:PREDICTED: G2/M phase-specific E3 ubiquitin-protein ligase-like [Austrofundulus limnaeus]